MGKIHTILASIFFVLIGLLSAAQTVGTVTIGVEGQSTYYASITDILRFDNYNDSLAGSNTGQNFVFTLENGDSLFFTLTRSGTAINAVTAPSWYASAFGSSTGYSGTLGQVVLYQSTNGNSNLTFTNFNAKNSLGGKLSDYTLVIFDGESTGSNEGITITTDSNQRGFYQWDVLSSSSTLLPTQSGLGSDTVIWSGSNSYSAYQAAYSVAIDTPSVISIALNEITSVGIEGVVIGIEQVGVHVTTAIPLVHKNNELKVYPNPTNSSANITLNSGFLTAAIKLINTTGQTVMEKDNVDGDRLVLSLSDYEAGIYFIEVKQNGLMWRDKIVIER